MKITSICTTVGTYWLVLNVILPLFRFQYRNSQKSPKQADNSAHSKHSDSSFSVTCFSRHVV